MTVLKYFVTIRLSTLVPKHIGKFDKEVQSDR